jgi:hypothetical protein
MSASRSPSSPPSAGALGSASAPRAAERTRRVELTAALGVAVVLGHLLFAQLTLVLLAAAFVTSRISRWRPLWLAAPAAAGALAVATVGPGPALAGFLAGPRQVAAYLGGLPGHPARVAHLAAAFAGAGRWLPRQLPLALLVAAAEAALAAWLARPGGRPSAAGRGPGGTAGYRPGLVILARGRRTRAALAAGRVVTVDGGALGVDDASGRAAEITWAEAGHGLLLAAADDAAAARAGFPLACAAVRRRKAVIVVDLTGSRRLAAALAAVCAAAGAPLARFGAGGPGCYEPFRSHPPGRAADLAARLIDWSGLTGPQQQAGRRHLADACAVLAAGPSGGPVLDGLIALLQPGALCRVAAGPPGAGRSVAAAGGAAGGAAADAETLAAVGGQLRGLRAGALGGWLRPAGAGPSAEVPVRLAQAVQDRGCVLFSLGPGDDGATVGTGRAAGLGGWAAGGPDGADGLGRVGRPDGWAADLGGEGRADGRAVGRLAVADLATFLGGLADQGLRGDSLVWIHGADAGAAADWPDLGRLIAAGPGTGTAVLVSTGSAAAAAALAGSVGVVVSSGPTEPRLAARLAELSPLPEKGGAQELADLLRDQPEGHFAVLAPGGSATVAGRLQPDCRSVPAAWGGPR